MNAQYNTTCPTCGATAGHPCTNQWGYPVSTVHPTRPTW